MARLKDLAETTSDVLNIPLDLIDVEPGFNVRHDTPDLAARILGITESILSQGYLKTKPLIVRQSDDQTRAIVVDGHCRLAAARMAVQRGAAIKTLPCLPEGRGVSPAERTLMLLTSNNGLELTPLEQATVVKRLISYGWTEAQIGSAIGRTRQHVANLLDLAGAPDEVRDMVTSGAVSATEAVKVVRKSGHGAVKVLLAAKQKATETGKRKVTAASIKAVTAPSPAPSPAPAPKPRPVLVAVNGATDAEGAAEAVARLWGAIRETEPEAVAGMPQPLAYALDRLREALQ